MAGSKTYDFMFKILGGLDPKFANSFRNADAKIQQSNKTLKELQNAMQALEGAYKAGTISANSFATNSKKITDRINKESQALDELTRQQREYQQTQQAFNAMGGNIKGMAAGAAAGLSVGMVVQDISAYQQAMGQAQALTGAMGEDWQNIKSSVEGVYTSGIAADMQDAANSVGQVRQIMGDLGGDTERASKNAILLRDTFGIEIPESTRAAKTMMEQFGISEEQAFTMMAQLAQQGANKNGDLADTLNEYSVKFAQLGYSAEQMGNMYVVGAKNGIWSIDKMGDAVKELSIKTIDGSKGTTEAFASLGLDADVMAQKFAKGGNDAQAAFKETVNALKAIEDPVQRNIAGVGLFGTMWEDLGEKSIFAMAEAENAINMNADTLDKIEQNKLNNLSSAFAQLSRTIEVQFIAPLAERATPIIQGFSEFLQEIDPTILIAAITGIGTAIAAFSAASFIAGLGGIGAAATAAAVAIGGISLPVLAAAAVLGVLVGAGVYVMQNWDEIKASAAETYASVSSYFSSMYTSVVNTIDNLVAEVKAQWESFTEFLSHPIEGSINIVKNIIGSDETPEAHAKGGFVPRMTLSYLAEKDPEMVIPINNSNRSMSLWEKTGQMLGVYPQTQEAFSGLSAGGSGFMDWDLEKLETERAAANNNISENNSIVFSPTITISGGNGGRVNTQEIQSQLKDSYREFTKFMDRYLKEKRRLSYA